MKFYITPLLIILLSITCLTGNAQEQGVFPKEIYKSNDIIINQITENSFIHISYLQTNDFGNVPCNGLIVINNKEAVVFDTPSSDKSSEELIKWINDKLQCKIVGIIPTHFHNDCLGGLKVFHEKNIPSFANFKTIELAKDNNFVVPQNSFKDSLVLKLGAETVSAKFFGEGHTRDNVVGYFPSENVLFGGCLIKELNANKGFLGDANLGAWSATVEKVKQHYPNVKTVIPGHGAHGNVGLLDYTIKLFGQQ